MQNAISPPRRLTVAYRKLGEAYRAGIYMICLYAGAGRCRRAGQSTVAPPHVVCGDGVSKVLTTGSEVVVLR